MLTDSAQTHQHRGSGGYQHQALRQLQSLSWRSAAKEAPRASAFLSTQEVPTAGTWHCPMGCAAPWQSPAARWAMDVVCVASMLELTQQLCGASTAMQTRHRMSGMPHQRKLRPAAGGLQPSHYDTIAATGGSRMGAGHPPTYQGCQCFSRAAVGHHVWARSRCRAPEAHHAHALTSDQPQGEPPLGHKGRLPLTGSQHASLALLQFLAGPASAIKAVDAGTDSTW